jgi:tetratricopeptide (TPR) repeat protein
MATGGADKLGVFISYSRDDLAFADQLEAALRLQKFDVVLDRKGISGGEKWEPRLGALIRDADTVAFVLSPTSAASPVCKWEVAEATRLGKRIIPVVCRPLGATAAPEQLAERNYIFFYEEREYPGSGFGTGLVRLVETLETDLVWLREGTRLIQRATEWHEGQRGDSRLLFGDSIAAAKSWLQRQPKNAPAPTTLLLDYIRTSEENETRRQSEDQRRLAEREELVRKAESEQTERQAAQWREAEQARRAVRIRTIGLAVALGLTAVSMVAGLNAWRGRQALAERTLDLEAANERLSAEMQLRIAPFGKRAYEIPEQWYKLATTNASSVAYIEFNRENTWTTVASGFVIRGKDLYPQWNEDPVFVTAGHVYYEQNWASGELRARIQFPALKQKPHVALGVPLWISADTREHLVVGNIDVTQLMSADAAVFSLIEKLPAGIQPITEISDVDVMQWPVVKFLRGGEAVAGSALERVIPLITLGAATNATNKDKDNSDGRKEFQWRLTLSLANALGRDQRASAAKGKFVATDSTTIGSSGTPIFDANDGRLVGIVQYGTPDPEEIEDGLAYSGGTTIRAIREAILDDAVTAADTSRRMFGEDNVQLAEMYLALARTRDASAAATLASVRAEMYFNRAAKKLKWGSKDDDAEAEFAKALQNDPALAGRIGVAWSETYVQRGKAAMESGKVADADALFQRAHQSSPGNAQAIDSAWATAYLDRGKSLLWKGGEEDAVAETQFLRALKLDSSVAAEINNIRADNYVDRGRDLLKLGRDDEAQAQFTKALQRVPSSSKDIDQAWVNTFLSRGSMLVIEGRTAEADAMLDRALKQDADHADITRKTWVESYLLYCVEVLLGQQRDDAAERASRSAIGQDPDISSRVDALWADAYVRRGTEKLATGNDAEAKTQFALARVRAGDVARHASVRAEIAEAWLGLGNPAEALADAEAYVTSKDDERGAAQLRGRIYLALDRIAEALLDLDKAVTLGDDRAETLVARGLCRERSGNRTGAIEDFRRVLSESASWQDDSDAQARARASLKALGVDSPARAAVDTGR